MLKQYYICDHCGKQLDEMCDYIDVKIGETRTDLCQKCFDEVMAERFYEKLGIYKNVDKGE